MISIAKINFSTSYCIDDKTEYTHHLMYTLSWLSKAFIVFVVRCAVYRQATSSSNFLLPHEPLIRFPGIFDLLRQSLIPALTCIHYGYSLQYMFNQNI